MTESQNASSEAVPSISCFKAMFTDLLAETKKDILVEVKRSIDQIYTDFEVVDNDMSPTEDDSFSQTQLSDRAGETSPSGILKSPNGSINLS